MCVCVCARARACVCVCVCEGGGREGERERWVGGKEGKQHSTVQKEQKKPHGEIGSARESEARTAVPLGSSPQHYQTIHGEHRAHGEKQTDGGQNKLETPHLKVDRTKAT